MTHKFVFCQYIHLYDVRNFSGGAFSEMQVQSKDVQEAIATQRIANAPSKPLTWKSIDFNLSGNRILVESDEGLTLVLDGYEGTVQRIFQSTAGNSTCACFTPDDQSVLIANDAGSIDCWNVQAGTMVKTLEGGDGGNGKKELTDQEKAEMEMELPGAALQQLSLWQLVLGYRLREAEVKGDHMDLLQ